MAYKESNSAFLSWEGTISRKDYAINMLIAVVSLIALYFTNFSVLVPQKFLYDIIVFLVQFLQFILIISVLSLIYRRIEDFSRRFTIKIQRIFKYLFYILCLFPIIYIFVLNYLLNIIPIITVILNISSLIAGFLGILFSIIVGLIKSE